MVALKLRAIGDQVGVILPRDVLRQLHVQEGDTLHLTEAPDGYRLTLRDPEFEGLEAARKVMRKRHNLLRKLTE